MTLYQQKIKNSSKVLYEYNAWGGRDSHKFGIVLMDSTKTFDVNSSKNLPITYLTEIPNSEEIKAIELKKPENNDSISLNALENKKIKISNIDIQINFFERYSGYSDAGCLLNEYRFQNFKETKDSLYFSGIVKKFGNNITKKRAGFRKGNIKLVADSIGKIFRVEVKELFKDKANKHKYKKGTAEIIERIPNSPTICLRTYYFIPKSDIYVSEFSDYGIFKPYKIK